MPTPVSGQAMPCHAMSQNHPHLCEDALRPAATDRDTGIPACMHTHHPGNYSWAREPVGFCRLRVEPSCHVRGSCPMQPTTPCPSPGRQRPNPCVCSRLTSLTVPSCFALTTRLSTRTFTSLPAPAVPVLFARAEMVEERLSAAHHQPLLHVLCSKAIASHICPPAPPPSFMTAMTRMIVGTCLCYCGTACHIPKGLVRACIRCTNCSMAADYCTEAQQDLPRVQRAGGLPRAGNLMRMRAPQSLGA